MSSSFSPPPYLLCPAPPGLEPYQGRLRAAAPPGLLPYLPPFHPHPPHHRAFSVYKCPFEPAFIQKRNERERQRVRCVNQGYAKLRDHLPGRSGATATDKRLSKVETLRAAIRYIKYLQDLVEPHDAGSNAGANGSPAGDCGGEPEVTV